MTQKHRTCFQDFLKNVFLFFCSLFFSLLLLELALRIWLPAAVLAPELEKTNWAAVPEEIWTEYHPLLGWYHQKNKIATLKSAFFPDVSVVTNAAGFRSSREYTKDIPPGKKRAVFLGDSFVFGFGVKEEETFAARIESLLPRYESINLGVPGYGIDQIYLAYKEIGKQYKADYVFICVFAEDFWRASRRFADSGQAKPYFTLTTENLLELHNVPVPQRFSLNKGQFPELIEETRLGEILRHSRAYLLLKRAAVHTAKNLRLIDPDTSLEWKLGRVILKELASEIRSTGAIPVLVIIPPENWVSTARKTSLRRSLYRFAGDNRLDLIDLAAPLHQLAQKGKTTDFYISGDWHWNSRGHEVAAREISAYLKGLNAAS